MRTETQTRHSNKRKSSNQSKSPQDTLATVDDEIGMIVAPRYYRM
jgi:hypothetical protein